MRILPITWLLSMAAACAPSAPDTPTAEPALPPEDTAATADPVTPPPTATTAKTASGPSDDTREMTARECKVLAEKYAALTRSDEEKKLPEKLTDAQRKQAKVAIDDVALKLSARWENGCSADLVGKAASESSLQCAMKAKTVAEFDTCLSGGGPAPSPED